MTETKRLIRILSIWGAIFAIVTGSLIHFLYGWSSNIFIVGLFAPVNESPWEHMKLVFAPLVIFGFIDFYFLRSQVKNYCFALLKEIGVAIVFILAVFYTYTSLTGHSILVIDITSFVIGILLAKWIGYKILIGEFRKWEFNSINIVSAIFLIVIAAFFIYATISPPHFDIFRDPITTKFGIYGNN